MTTSDSNMVNNVSENKSEKSSSNVGDISKLGNLFCNLPSQLAIEIGTKKQNKKRVVFFAARSLRQESSTLGSTLHKESSGIGSTGLEVEKWRTGKNGDGVRPEELFRHPLAIVSLVPKHVRLFLAGVLAAAAATTCSAPLDRAKMLMQVHGAMKGGTTVGWKKSVGFVEVLKKVRAEEGLRGFWKGNLPQVIRAISYSAVEPVAYKTYTRIFKAYTRIFKADSVRLSDEEIFKGDTDQLSVVNTIVAGAFAGMTSTLVTYPLDTVRLRMAVDPASKKMGQVVMNMVNQEGFASLYCGLGPALLGFAPCVALSFGGFYLMKKGTPEDLRTTSETSLTALTVFVSLSLTAAMCYSLDTVRRQLQIRGTPFKNMAEAFPGIVARDGFRGLYRGVVPNTLEALVPRNRIRQTVLDTTESVNYASQTEYDKLLSERRVSNSNDSKEGLPRDSTI